MRVPIPLRRRPIDIIFVVFFLINFGFITYIVDLEQLVIADPSNFTYPAWPPAMLVNLVHWWGRTFDPVLLARPVWWKMTIWVDAIGFGPFYLFALYAWIKGRDWIRLPAVLWAGLMIANVTIIMGEEMMGPHATPHPGMVWAANLPWLLFPIAVFVRMLLSEHPFTQEASTTAGS